MPGPYEHEGKQLLGYGRELERYLYTVEVRDSSSLGPTPPTENRALRARQSVSEWVMGPRNGETGALQGPSGNGP